MGTFDSNVFEGEVYIGIPPGPPFPQDPVDITVFDIEAPIPIVNASFFSLPLPILSDYVAFDSNVFDWSSSIMNIIPTFNKIIMEREFQRVEAGQAVAILCSIQDIMTTPGQRFQFDPTITPQIIIYNPDNSIRVGWTNMTFVSTGVYIYQYQTLPTDSLGIYTAQFQAIDGSMTGITDNVAIFEVIK